MEREEKIMEDVSVVKRNTSAFQWLPSLISSLVLAAVMFVYNRLDKLNESVIRLDENVKANAIQQNEMKATMNKLLIDYYDLKRDVEILKTRYK